MRLDLADVLVRLAPHGGLAPLLRLGFAQATGLVQVLTTRAAIVELLEDPSVLVPYGERSTPLGLDRFPLALDGDEHAAARQLVVRALAASDDAHQAGLVAAADELARRLGEGDRRVELVGDVVEPALFAWTETWFGLAGQGVELLASGRLILHATFLNPKVPKGAIDLVALRRAVDQVQEHRVRLVEAMADAPAGTLSHSLLAETGHDEAGRDLAARHLLGLTVGPLALVHQSVTEAVDHLLGAPWRLDAADDAGQATASFLWALRRCPPLAGVLRVSPHATDVYGGRRHVDVPEGVVLAATSCPARSGDARAPELAFGHGPHRCLGEQHTVAMAVVVLQALALRRPRRAPGPDGRRQPAAAPSGVRQWDFPGRLVLRLA